MPRFLYVTKAIMLKDTRPRSSPFISIIAKLNKKIEFLKKLTINISPLMQKLIEMIKTENANVMISAK